MDNEDEKKEIKITNVPFCLRNDIKKISKKIGVNASALLKPEIRKWANQQLKELNIKPTED